MCIAILNKSGQLGKKELHQASQSNPDGAGMMYSDGRKIHVFKSLINKEVIEKYREFRSKDNHTPVVLHFRIATDGGITQENVHPYKINDQVQLVHNGILQNYSGKKTAMSDTRLFIADILSLIPTKEIFTNHMLKLIGQAIGYNKFILLRNNGEWAIVNESLGHWDKEKNNWFSNTSYKPVIAAIPVVYSGASYKGQAKYYQRHGHSKSMRQDEYCIGCGMTLYGKEKKLGYCKWCLPNFEL